MISFVFTQASLPSSPCGSSSLGPSGAFSYAVGFVAPIRQLQDKHRGFHRNPQVSTLQVSTWAPAFHNEAAPGPCRLHYRPIRACQQQVCSTLKGAL